LSGKGIADGKYVLREQPFTSSGKSKIYLGYRTTDTGNPTGNTLAIKVSPSFEALSRENKNYDKVASGLFQGRFVKKIEFVPELNSFVQSAFDTQCALVMEAGEKNLKDVVAAQRGLTGNALKVAAKAAAECIQGIHSSGLVWTDLKTSNFVQVDSGVKGVDLESGMPHRSSPVDYSPEACPPEFARSYMAGDFESFPLDYSYDIWSYGMYLYELAAGRPYFGGKNPKQITSELASPGFEADVADVGDSKLRDLIQQCLNSDPKSRPNIVQVLVHPYLTGFR
jgi:serine/threonine protein kinase